VAADLNHDGKLDLATASLAGSSSAPSATFTVFFGNGNGTFQSGQVHQVPFSVPANYVAAAPAIVAGDFNGDAILDLGVETGAFCGGSACGEAQMNIYLNNGSGGFVFKSKFATASNEGPTNWLAGDLNNDLKIDLARYSSSLRTGNVRTWLNNGAGTFSGVSNPYAGFDPVFAELRDLDLDGRHDVVFADWDFGDTDLAVEMNHNGTANCPPPPSNVLQAKMCSPGSTTSSTTFTVKASGNSPLGVQRMELWVDGVKRAQALNDQLRKTLTLAAGKHTLTIVAVDKYVGFAKTTKAVTVP
jgi:hypothetical protein